MSGAGATRRPLPADYEDWSADPSCNEERIAYARRSGDWVPGANGTERPFRSRSGVRLLWCWRPATGEHHYLNCDSDIILSDAEARALMGEDPLAERPRRSAAARRREINRYLPRELKRAGYYNAINLQHFNRESALGSVFTSIPYLGRLLDACIEQRGSLDGDDRAELLSLGAEPTAFAEPDSGVRYLKVVADGEGGMVAASQLNPGTPVRVVRSKADTPCSLVVDSGCRQPTFVGTIIIGPNRQPQPSTKFCVWTAHPGLPVAPPAVEDIWPEGTVVSAGAVLAHFRGRGRDDVALKIQHPQPSVPAATPPDRFERVLGRGRGRRR